MSGERMRSRTATLAVLALTATLLAGCGDDGQTDATPCGTTGTPAYNGGATGSFDGVRQSHVEAVDEKGGSGGGGSSGGGGKGSSGGGAKSGTSGGGSSGSKASTGSTAFKGSTTTGSRTFTSAGGTKYAVAPRSTQFYHAPSYVYVAPPPLIYTPGYHYLSWYMWGNYPGSTTIIECR